MIKRCEVTLNVGLGTFKPVRAENILDHEMESEHYEISEETANIINEAKLKVKKLLQLVQLQSEPLNRVLKIFENISPFRSCEKWAGFQPLFIYPGFNFNVDG